MFEVPISFSMPNRVPAPCSVESWEKLAVLRKAHRLVIEIYRVSQNFPREERFGLTSQLRRAAASVPTNIAEGTGRRTTKDYVQFLVMARGSIEEVKYLLLLVRDLGHVCSEDYSQLRNGFDEIGRMLNGLISALERRLTR